MKSSQYSLALLCALAFAFLSTPTGATTIVSDGFDDGGRTNGADPTDIQWYSGRSNVALSVTPDVGIGSGNALFVDSSTTFSRSVGLLDSGLTLGVGETLEFSFDLRYATDAAAGSQLLRVGIYNNAGTAIPGDGGANQDDDFGYGFHTNPGSASATGTRVATETAGNSILGGASPFGFISTGASGASINWGSTAHSAVFSMTRLGDGTLDLLASIDGGAAASANVAAINGNYTFHEVGIGMGNINRDIYVDNVQLTVVPEPSTLALLGLGVLGCLARRRR